MSIYQEHTELQSVFAAGWGNTCPVEWPNVTFTPPTPDKGAKWVRFTIKNDDSPLPTQFTMGAGKNFNRFPGVIIVQIFIANGGGSAPALQLADTVAGILGGYRGTNITCRNAKIKEVGKTEDTWYQVNVTVPFYRDELL